MNPPLLGTTSQEAPSTDELASSSNPPSPERSEWVRFLAGLVQGDVQESFHPNAYGQQAMGRCLSLVVARSGDDFACRPNGPGTDDMRLRPLSSPPRGVAEEVAHAHPHAPGADHLAVGFLQDIAEHHGGHLAEPPGD